VLCLTCKRRGACRFSHEEEIYRIKIQLRDETKKPLCMKYWVHSYCEFGKGCKWSHGDPFGFEPWLDMMLFITEEPSRNTKICKAMMNRGECDLNNMVFGCKIAHDNSELRGLLPWNKVFPRGNSAFRDDKTSMRWLSQSYHVDLREIPNHETFESSYYPHFSIVPISRMQKEMNDIHRTMERPPTYHQENFELPVDKWYAKSKDPRYQKFASDPMKNYEDIEDIMEDWGKTTAAMREIKIREGKFVLDKDPLKRKANDSKKLILQPGPKFPKHPPSIPPSTEDRGGLLEKI